MPKRKSNSVMVVHGRNIPVRDALYEFLRTWRQRARHLIKLADECQTVLPRKREKFLEKVIAAGGSTGPGVEANWDVGNADGKLLVNELAAVTHGQGNLLVFQYTPGVACDEREATLLRYLKALLQGEGRPPMHLHEEAREHGWSDEQILEAIAYVALERFTAMVNVAGDVPVDGSVEDTRTLRAA